PAMALGYYALGFITRLTSFLIFKTGLHLRFRDPSLTSPQIVVAPLLHTYLLALDAEIRGTLMVAYCLILPFGVCQMSRTAYLIHAALALVCYASLIVINQYLGIYPQSLTVALLEWFILACFLLWLIILGSYI